MDFRLSHIPSGRRGAGVLKLSPESGRKDRTVVVLHGLGSSKEGMLLNLYALAKSGFDAVAIDLFLHGDRPHADDLVRRIDTDLAEVVLEIIYESAADIPIICGELGIDVAQAGLVGISAGGFVAHALAVQRPQFKAMVAAISSPEWLTVDPAHSHDPASPRGLELARISPVNMADRYAPMAVCLLNAIGDEVVSSQGTQKLAARLAPIYADLGIGDRLKLVAYPEIGHAYTDAMLQQTIDWMNLHI